MQQGVEACDDGNDIDDDGCSNACELPRWRGDGIVQAGEACDDGNADNTDACQVDVKLLNAATVSSKRARM